MYVSSYVYVSCSVVSVSLWPHGLQHTRLPYPSPTPGAYSNSCPSSPRWHPTTSSSVIPFSSGVQSFPASGTFPLSQFFTSGGESVWVWINIYCTLAALSLRNRRMLINLLHKIWMYSPLCISSVQSLSRVWLCDPMNCSTPGLPVHHQLPEFTQTHVHRVSDAIQPSHPLSSPSPPAPNPSQHQSLFQWVNSLHEVAKVLEFQL